MSHSSMPIADRAAAIPLTTRIQELDLMGRELERHGERVVYLTAGEPDFDTPKNIRTAAAEALEASFTHYTSNRGLIDLREALAHKLEADNSISADPAKEILVTSGGAQALFLALMATLNPGDEVIVQDPSYGPYATTIRLLGCEPVFAPSTLDGSLFRPDLNAMESVLTPRTRALVINSPCNPTGVVYTRQELEALGEFVCRHDLMIITDEVYEYLVYDSNVHVSIASLGPDVRNRTITVNSLSKTYAMTGWRLGYVIAPAPVIDVIAMIQQNSGRMATAFVQKAAIEALQGTQDTVRAMVDEYRTRRTLVTEALASTPGLHCAPPEGAFYVFASVSELGVNGLEFAKHVLKHGKVAVTPGDFFGPAGTNFVRLTFAKDRDSLSQAMNGIQAAAAMLSRGRLDNTSEIGAQ